jgi:hypothetical protein
MELLEAALIFAASVGLCALAVAAVSSRSHASWPLVVVPLCLGGLPAVVLLVIGVRLCFDALQKREEGEEQEKVQRRAGLPLPEPAAARQHPAPDRGHRPAPAERLRRRRRSGVRDLPCHGGGRRRAGDAAAARVPARVPRALHRAVAARPPDVPDLPVRRAPAATAGNRH